MAAPDGGETRHHCTRCVCSSNYYRVVSWCRRSYPRTFRCNTELGVCTKHIFTTQAIAAIIIHAVTPRVLPLHRFLCKCWISFSAAFPISDPLLSSTIVFLYFISHFLLSISFCVLIRFTAHTFILFRLFFLHTGYYSHNVVAFIGPLYPRVMHTGLHMLITECVCST